VGYLSRSLKQILLCILILAFSILLLPAAGQREKESLQKLESAEQLIAEKQYNQAILVLTDLVRRDADKFAAAEKLMQVIRDIRSEYNSKYDELIVELFEKNDLKRSLELIEEMEELDPYPNEAVTRSLARAREGFELIYILDEFKALMDTAVVQLESAEYNEAIATYLGGYDLYRSNFEGAGYGNITVAAVNANVETTRSSARSLVELQDSIDREVRDGLERQMERLLADPAEPGLQQLRADLEQGVFYKRAVERSAADIQEQNRLIKEVGGKGEYDWYLYLVEQLSSGREDSQVREGLAAAMELRWGGTTNLVVDRLTLAGDSFRSRSISAYRTDNFDAARSSLEKAARIYNEALVVQGLWGGQLNLVAPPALERWSEAVAARELPRYLNLQEKIKEIRAYGLLADSAQELAVIQSREATGFKDLTAAQSEVLSLKESTAAEAAAWRELADRYRRIARLGYDLGGLQAAALDMDEEHTLLIDRMEAQNIRYVTAIADLGLADWEETLQEFRQLYDLASGYVSGVEVVLEKSDQGEVLSSRTERYPDRALEVFGPLGNEVKGLSGEIKERFLDLTEGQEFLSRDPSVQARIDGAVRLQKQLTALQSGIAENTEEAQYALLQAERFRRDGYDLYNDAQNNLRQNAFDGARESAQAAAAAFAQSIAFKEDAELRRFWDGELRELEDDINQRAITRVVDEKNELVAAAKTAYDRGNFLQAEELLLRARARWAVANDEEEPVITTWLNLVRSALSTEKVRVIEESNPLYAEMTQLYNLAVSAYQSGKELIEENRKTEAIAYFRRAEDKLARIRRVFPKNRDASVLALEILKLDDPEQFGELLDDMFIAAVRKLDSPSKADHNDAYSDLQDVQYFLPTYPGLAAALERAEIKLGRRLPPPDPAKLAESRELYGQASAIYNQRRPELYPVALELLNQALVLNPDNGNASDLKDTIQIATGGKKPAIVSSEVASLLREAEKRFIEGNYVNALVIVNRLLSDPRNLENKQLADDLNELKKRIESRI
jgi:hypothetical protein